MNVQQDKSKFKSIKIELNTRSEARAFFRLIDKFSNDDNFEELDAYEREVIIKLSDSVTDMKIQL